MNKQEQLVTLIAALFSASALRMFVSFRLAAIANAINYDQALNKIAFDVVSEAKRHGLIDAAFWDALVEKYPRRRPAIDPVRAAWETAEAPAPAVVSAGARFTEDELTEIHRRIINADLVGELDELNDKLAPAVRSMLPTHRKPNVRLMTTLAKLNNLGRLPDGTIPFAAWLRAAALLTAGTDKEAFFRTAAARADDFS